VLRDRAAAMLGGHCVRCGVTDRRVLVFDHRVALRGRRRESASRILNAILAGSEAYQLLCHNCNHLKRLDDGEHGGRRLEAEL
jgi:hypothetical protein